MFFCQIVWILGSVVMLDELGTESDGNEMWRGVTYEYHSGLSLAYIPEQKSKLDHAGYNTLDGMPDPFF